MDKGPFSKAAAQNALDRLIDVARSDTRQLRRVANFLLAWWNGEDGGHFPPTDLLGVTATNATHNTPIDWFRADAMRGGQVGVRKCGVRASQYLKKKINKN